MNKEDFFIMTTPIPPNRWEISITPPGDVTIMLRDEAGEETDRYELTPEQMVRALRRIATEALDSEEE